MTPGQEFVKKIGPVGIIIFLLLFVAFLVVCFTPPKNAPDTQEPPAVSEFFSPFEGRAGV